MQKIDRPGVDFHQHVLSDQLIEIMAGGISLHRETPGQPAGGKDFAQVIRIEKIGLILQKANSSVLRIASPSSPLRRDMMREIRQPLALNSFLRFRAQKNDAPIRGRRTTNRLQPRQGLAHPRAQNHFQIARDLGRQGREWPSDPHPSAQHPAGLL